MVCPIIKTREALYRGGFIPDSEEDTNGLVRVDGAEFYLNDAPTLVALESYSNVRSKMTGSSESSMKMSVKDLRAYGILNDMEAREHVRNLVKTGSAQVCMNATEVTDDLVGAEKKMVQKIKSMTRH